MLDWFRPLESRTWTQSLELKKKPHELPLRACLYQQSPWKVPRRRRKKELLQPKGRPGSQIFELQWEKNQLINLQYRKVKPPASWKAQQVIRRPPLMTQIG
jgi:hypothetical protein